MSEFATETLVPMLTRGPAARQECGPGMLTQREL